MAENFYEMYLEEVELTGLWMQKRKRESWRQLPGQIKRQETVW